MAICQMANEIIINNFTWVYLVVFLSIESKKCDIIVRCIEKLRHDVQHKKIGIDQIEAPASQNPRPHPAASRLPVCVVVIGSTHTYIHTYIHIYIHTWNIIVLRAHNNNNLLRVPLCIYVSTACSTRIPSTDVFPQLTDVCVCMYTAHLGRIVIGFRLMIDLDISRQIDQLAILYDLLHNSLYYQLPDGSQPYILHYIAYVSWVGYIYLYNALRRSSCATKPLTTAGR